MPRHPRARKTYHSGTAGMPIAVNMPKSQHGVRLPKCASHTTHNAMANPGADSITIIAVSDGSNPFAMYTEYSTD